MLGQTLEVSVQNVALRKESVDRNRAVHSCDSCRALVALRKESVDRNSLGLAIIVASPKVALRKESVDRNILTYTPKIGQVMSLSARRAWIEITKLPRVCLRLVVALRKESVDRNLLVNP